MELLLLEEKYENCAPKTVREKPKRHQTGRKRTKKEDGEARPAGHTPSRSKISSGNSRASRPVKSPIKERTNGQETPPSNPQEAGKENEIL